LLSGSISAGRRSPPSRSATASSRSAQALTLDAHVRALIALGVLVTAMTFAFVAAVWLLRSLQGLSATR
jgi:hypothetical protein